MKKKVKKYKMKTKKSAAKRIKVTASGKLKRYAAGMRHLLEHESANKKRNKRGTLTIAKSDERKIKMMLPGV
ncbi:MAG: large subunit ribosomal protein L35 [Candidatus Marinamargulisbacteria bacterium]|jgi:large subunit ribosomal protein L35